MIKKFTLVVGLGLIWLTIFLNQGKADVENLISVRFSAIALDQNIEGLNFMSNNEVGEIDIYTSTRSRLHRYQGPPRLTFFREVEDAEGELIRTPVGSVVLDESTDRYLLFFIRRNSDTEQYSILALPDGLSDFTPGSFRFINLAPFRIAIQIGEERILLNERDYGDVRGRFEHGNHYKTLMISLPEGEDPLSSYSGRLFFNQRMRMMYIIFPDLDGRPGQVRFTGIPDAVRTDSQ